MHLYLKREQPINEATPGKLHIDGKFFCYTLEDLVRLTKLWGKTAISAGQYFIIMAMMTDSKGEQRLLPKLMNVPEFTGIYLHKLNRVDQTNGCIGIGFQRDKDVIWESTKAEEELVRICLEASKREVLGITIHDADNIPN